MNDNADETLNYAYLIVLGSVSLIDQHITLKVSSTFCSPKLFIDQFLIKRVYVLGRWPKMGQCVCMRTCITFLKS